MRNIKNALQTAVGLLKISAMVLIFIFVLKPLIKRNYALRLKSAINGDGKHPDKWYWADSLAARFGFLVEDIDYPSDATLAAWPDCAIPGCLNKCCKAEGSVYCWPHSHLGEVTNAEK